MKKQLSLLSALFIQTTLAFSQTRDVGSVSLSIGPAFPTGQFRSTNLYDASSGFAKTGETVSFEYAKPFPGNWSFLINLAGQRNPINTKSFENSLSTAKIYQGFSLGSDPTNPPPQTNYTVYQDWKFEKKAWLYGALQVGGKRKFSVNRQNKNWLTTDATLGILYATSPQLNGRSVTDTASAVITQSKSSGFGFIFSIGGGFDYYLGKRFVFTTALKYTGTNKVAFKGIKSTLTTTKGAVGSPNYSISQSTVTSDGKQSLNSINLSFGIGVFL